MSVSPIDEGSRSPTPAKLNKIDFLIPGSDPPKYYCPGCRQERSHSSWNDHQRRGCASRPSKPSAIPCPECEKTFSLRRKMTEHYYKEHGPVLMQQRKFSNGFLLAKFKRKLEDESGYRFYNHAQSGKTVFFVCKKGYKNPTDKNNEGPSCSAYMNVELLEDGQFLMQYCNYHVHEPSTTTDENQSTDENETEESEDLSPSDLLFDLSQYDETTQELKPGVIKEKMYISPNDDGSCSPTPAKLNRMDYLIPGSDPPKFYCPGCRQERSHSSWNDHQRRGCASRPSRPSAIPCPECEKTFSLRKKMTEHYYKEHGPELVQQRKFSNGYHLAKFKRKLEEESGFKFQNQGQSGLTVYFICKKGYKNALSKNNGTVCTAYMNVDLLEDGQYLVHYCNSHIHGPSVTADNNQSADEMEPEDPEELSSNELLFDLSQYDEKTQELENGIIKEEPIDDILPSTSTHTVTALVIPKEEISSHEYDVRETTISTNVSPNMGRIFITGNVLSSQSIQSSKIKKLRQNAAAVPCMDQSEKNYSEFLSPLDLDKPHRLQEFVIAEKKLIQLELLVSKNGTSTPEAQRALRMLHVLSQTVDDLTQKFATPERPRLIFDRKRPHEEDTKH